MRQRPVLSFLITVAMAAASSASYAASTTGRVIAVSDGDTLSILRDSEQVKIRLAEIDAPEKAQAFGAKSKQSLSDLCFGKDAEIEELGRDRYGRTIGRITCAGIDANAEQVSRGMAWVFDRYVTDRTLYRLQDDARSARRGLWADQSPTPPWEWRKGNRLR